MTRLLKSSFLHRFVAGFVLGTIGVVAMQPATTAHFVATHSERVAG